MLIVLVWIMVSIVCESLPLSSSGHVALLEHWYVSIADMPMYASWLIQGPIAIILALFFVNRWMIYFYHPRRSIRLIKKLFVYGCMVESLTVAFFIFFRVFHVAIPLWIGVVISGSLLWSLWYTPLGSRRRLDMATACMLGVVQGIALLPGISRLASTLVLLRWLGFAWSRAWEISFLIEWPLCMGGFLYGIFSWYDGHGAPQILHLSGWLTILISSVIGYFELYGVAYLLQTHRLSLFSWYLFCMSVYAWYLGV